MRGADRPACTPPVEAVRDILRTAADDVTATRDRLLRPDLEERARLRAAREVQRAEQSCSWPGSPPTPAPAAASLQPSSSATPTATSSPSAAAPPTRSSAPPRPAGSAASPSAPRRPSAGGRPWPLGGPRRQASPGLGAAAFGPWLFSRSPDHGTRLTTGCAGHWFAALAHRAGHGDVTLHRLRHAVATVLVGQGDILQAQHRLGHRDDSTTLRIYSHALPLTDADAAATLDRLYR
ncbi:MAG: tyrosine-type recombinase/integrase [Kineosporiaceae bacterium]